MGTSKVTNVGAPTTSTDVATKGYVDSQAYSPFGSSTSHSIRVSSAAPSGGADGDIWIRI
jgi:hypothetical protein